jgi:hypothetical protein
VIEQGYIYLLYDFLGSVIVHFLFPCGKLVITFGTFVSTGACPSVPAHILRHTVLRMIFSTRIEADASAWRLLSGTQLSGSVDHEIKRASGSYPRGATQDQILYQAGP